MNRKQEKTLRKIFNPTTRALAWRDIQSLFNYLGAKEKPGDGSRVTFEHGNAKVCFHVPHGKDACAGRVRKAKDFLKRAGVKPKG